MDCPSFNIKTDKSLTFKIIHSLNHLNDSWLNFLKNQDVLFFKKEFLEVCEKNMHESAKQYYVLICKENEPYAFFVMQKSIVPLISYKDMLSEKNFFNWVIEKSKTDLTLITMGQNFISGNFGQIIKYPEKVETIFNHDFTKEVLNYFELNKCLSIFLLKDANIENFDTTKHCFYKKTLEVNVEPDMVISLTDEIKNINMYLSLFSKKYRQRYRRVIEKGKYLNFYSLNAYDFNNSPEFYSLFLNVYHKARWKVVMPKASYFSEMKIKLPNNFFMEKIVFKNNIVGFLSYFIYKNKMWAHYIGLDYDINKVVELYQNILLRFIELGIQHKVKKIHLGRTAPEIKSCIGANPVYYRNFILAGNLISYWVLKEMVPVFSEKEWIKRNPFQNNKNFI